MGIKTHVIGFPRIGSLRELKFALEKYFKNEIDQNELEAISKEIRLNNYKILKNIDYIPSNDFSYYDNLLDTAYLFNIIPQRYKKLNLSKIDTYFAMARGYQHGFKDVKALAMKKWFNTNYHYIVPEFDDDIELKINSTKPFDLYIEAKELGYNTTPSIIGPLTLLKLIRFTGNKNISNIKDEISLLYKEILNRFTCLGASWIQIQEPILVTDLSSDDKKLFKELYNNILSDKSINVLLQTYFGDVRDFINEINDLAFDGVGLDFIEGSKTLDLVNKINNKIIFAGVINGKNIWKNNYKKTIDIINKINNKNIVISTSCSLQHVPYTIENEEKLSDSYLRHFSFAKEKVNELNELKNILENNNNVLLEENQKLFNIDRNCNDIKVRERINSIDDKLFERLPKFSEREQIQKKKFMLPLLPTTTIGSFPQTKDVKLNRSSYKKGLISKEEYINFNKEKIKECIKFQEEIGLDVLVHGEYERNDMVEYFGENLNGYIFTDKAWVQSYGTRCVKPPVIWGDISRRGEITVSWLKYAKSLTNKPIKGMLTGPVTILNWSFPREDISIKESALQIAFAIRDEVLDLEKNGIDIIQIDEAALREKLPLRKEDWDKEYLSWAIPAFRLVHSGVKPETQIHTHMCYSEFKDIISAIDDMDADVITFEASRSDLLILDELKKNNFKTEVGPGVYDIHSPRVPSVKEIEDAILEMINKLGYNKLWVNPDCGLKTRGEAEVKESLLNLVTAAKNVRLKL